MILYPVLHFFFFCQKWKMEILEIVRNQKTRGKNTSRPTIQNETKPTHHHSTEQEKPQKEQKTGQQIASYSNHACLHLGSISQSLWSKCQSNHLNCRRFSNLGRDLHCKCRLVDLGGQSKEEYAPIMVHTVQ